VKKFGKKLEEGVKQANHEIDKGTRQLDNKVSSTVEMPEGAKVGHIFNPDSQHHKEAVKEVTGRESQTENHETPLAGDHHDA
jgi:hypothetical protein